MIGARHLRAFLAVAVLLALELPLSAHAQPHSPIAKVGIFANGGPNTSPTIDSFRRGLRDLGYVEGQNLFVEVRWAEGRFERMPEHAAELVRWKPDVLVATAPYGINAVRRATSTIPVVMIACDPAEAIVEHIARPSGHITGVTCMSSDITPKRLQLLKETIPNAVRVAVMFSAFDPHKAEEAEQMQVPARTLGMTLVSFPVSSEAEIARAIAEASAKGANALFVLPDPLTIGHRARISELAIKYRLPSMYGFKEFVLAGGLISYGTMQDDLYRRAANHVNKILKGAKPADVPVEQATLFELFINKKTADAIGIKIPDTVLVRADKVIE